MILRLSTSAARGSLVLLGIALVSMLSYSGIRNALAVHYAGLNSLDGFERATRLESSDAQNWYLLGRYWQYNLEEPDSQKAIRAYQKSLSLDPHSADAWSDLAMAYESENNFSAAGDAFLAAQRAYPLSPEVAWRYGNFLLRRGNMDAAYAEVKRAVQVDPARGAAAFALFMRVEPDINVDLDRALPDSANAYLSVLSALADQQKTDQAMVVWDKLVPLRPRLKLSDAGALLEALIHNRQTDTAQRVWNQTLILANVSRPADPQGSLVWDGGFESDVVNVGFSWRYPQFTGGVQIGPDSRERHSGNRSLRLTFNGLSNVDFHDVCQYVVIQPATPYRFAAWVQTRSLSTDEGIRFGLYPMEDAARSATWTWSDDIRGTQPWTQIELEWTSSADTRELLICATRLPSRKFDSKIHGLAWIDDVSLAPVSKQSLSR